MNSVDSRKILTVVRDCVFWLLMSTWCLPQTLAGLCLWRVKYRRCPYSRYHGAIVVAHNGKFGGVSLGGVTFVSDKLKGKSFDRTAAHEYGHCIQSLLLGPLYLPAIALPSGLWCNLPSLVKMRSDTGKSYYSFFTEKWANSLCYAVTKDMPSGYAPRRRKNQDK